MTTELTASLLATLSSRWQEAAGSGVEILQPGSDEASVTQRLADHGLQASEEVRLWWEWQNGPVPTSGAAYARTPAHNLLPLDSALVRREAMMGIAGRRAADWGLSPEEMWSPTWLPLLKGAAFIVADLGGDSRLSPVRKIEHAAMTPDDWQRVRLPSIGAMVQLWIELIDSGLWCYNRESGIWDVLWDEVPAGLKLTGLSE